jgi:hypothetical protein
MGDLEAVADGSGLHELTNSFAPQEIRARMINRAA